MTPAERSAYEARLSRDRLMESAREYKDLRMPKVSRLCARMARDEQHVAIHWMRQAREERS